jgi:excisionase family DNA binding protein
VIIARVATKKAQFTITEAAKKLGVSRAAVHKAIKENRLDATWGETIQVVRTLVITAENLKAYKVDSSRQERGKKTDLG